MQIHNDYIHEVNCVDETSKALRLLIEDMVAGIPIVQSNAWPIFLQIFVLVIELWAIDSDVNTFRFVIKLGTGPIINM